MISEIDIKDWQRSFTKTELYNAPRNSIVSLVDDPEIPFLFRNVDGMYSYCSMLDGSSWHPAAWSDVFIWRKK